jgi:hypothetical protein
MHQMRDFSFSAIIPKFLPNVLDWSGVSFLRMET